MSSSMKDHVVISLNERSTSRTEFGNEGADALALAISEMLFDFRISRWRFGSFAKHSIEAREVMWLSSSVRSTTVGLGVCDVSSV